MREIEKARLGYLYDANNDLELIKNRIKCSDLCFKFNNTLPSDVGTLNNLTDQIFNKHGVNSVITPPIHIDYGYNTTIGDNFYSNYNLTILDTASVTIGNNVFIAPNCVLSCAGHALDSEKRNKGLEIARPIKIEDNVWLGANVTVLPGITIGHDSIIGAGSVVTKDIPPFVIAVGNPCKVLRKISDKDKDKYKVYTE